MTYKFQCEDKDYTDWKALNSRDLTLAFDKTIIKDDKFNNFDPVS